MTKEEAIQTYGLSPHPEGGYFKEAAKSDLPYDKERTLFSSILFLLGKGDVSHLHVLEEEELWIYQGGDDLDVYEIDGEGNLNVTTMGIGRGKELQHLVRRGTVFGSKSAGEGWSLVGCVVSPSFTYRHFRLIEGSELPKMKSEDRQKVEELLCQGG